MNDPSVNKIKRNIYMTYFKDGFWDILLGIFVLGWGLGILTDTAAFAGVWVVIAYPIVLSLKAHITYPRIGYVKVPQERRTLSRLLIIGVASFILGLLSYFLATSGFAVDWLEGYYMFLFGLVLAVPIALIAYWWCANRWYVFAALILAGASSHQWLDIELSYSYIVPGAVILLWGAFMFVRFLRNYPKPAGENVDDGQ